MGFRVLIVDDSPVLRRVVARALAVSGFELDELYQAANGAEALALIAEHPLDLVLADITMPQMSGIELVERLAAERRLGSLKVVMLSSVRSRERIDYLRGLGVRAYLTKPFKPEQLRAVVGPLLEEGAP